MKISEVIAKLEADPNTKALGTELRGDLAAILDQDTKAIGAAVTESAGLREKLTKAEGQVTELSASVKSLDEKAKGADDLKKKVEGFETEKRAGLVGAAFKKAAKEHGIPEEAHATAEKLVDLSALKVNEKGEVAGLTKELFDGLTKAHPVLLNKTAAPAGAAQTSPALPPAAPASASAGKEVPKIEGPMGFFMQAHKL